MRCTSTADSPSRLPAMHIPGDSIGITLPRWFAPNAVCSSAYYLAGEIPIRCRHFGSARRSVPHATGLNVHWMVSLTASTDTLLQQFHAATRDIDASSAFSS
ncbi:MAG: hypothetical protein ACR5LD_09095 [Symbiopectobacterium sp.]